MAILGPIVGFLIVVVLLVSFRRVAGIILPLAGLLICAAVSLGIMALLDITFTMATMLVPVLLLIVAAPMRSTS
jgi:predicted RND superfamily exporter protein